MPGMSKYWCWTLNNPTDGEIQALGTLSSGILFQCHQTEEGASGTTHLQGYSEFAKRKRLATVRKTPSYSRMHLETRKGTAAEAIAYCCKEGGSGYAELGSASSKEAEVKKRAWHTIGIVHWGLSGSGKTHQAHDMYGQDAFYKDPTTRWWDGYNGEATVIIDDFQGGSIGTDWSREYWCRIIDKQPMQVETKGGHVPFLAKRVIFTSNYNPGGWYGGHEAVMRRITYVKEHTQYFKHPKGTGLRDIEYEQAGEAYELVNGNVHLYSAQG